MDEAFVDLTRQIVARDVATRHVKDMERGVSGRVKARDRAAVNGNGGAYGGSSGGRRKRRKKGLLERSGLGDRCNIL